MDDGVEAHIGDALDDQDGDGDGGHSGPWEVLLAHFTGTLFAHQTLNRDG